MGSGVALPHGICFPEKCELMEYNDKRRGKKRRKTASKLSFHFKNKKGCLYQADGVQTPLPLEPNVKGPKKQLNTKAREQTRPRRRPYRMNQNKKRLKGAVTRSDLRITPCHWWTPPHPTATMPPPSAPFPSLAQAKLEAIQCSIPSAHGPKVLQKGVTHPTHVLEQPLHLLRSRGAVGDCFEVLTTRLVHGGEGRLPSDRSP